MQPLAVDWREKLKAARKPSQNNASAALAASAASQPTGSASDIDASDVVGNVTADGKPNLELLSKGLPAGWRAMWDKNSGDIYYGNLKTRVRVTIRHLLSRLAELIWHWKGPSPYVLQSLKQDLLWLAQSTVLALF